MKVQTFIMFALQLFNIMRSNEQKNDRIVKAQYKLFLDSYYMFSKHGSPSNNFYLALDITSPLTRISKLSYGYQRSKTNSFIQNTTIELNNDVILLGTEYEDQLGVNNSIIPKFSYIVTEKNEKDYSKNNLYAMAYKISNTNHSITHQLKNYDLIDHLSFSFTRIINETGSIYFGGIPYDKVKGLYNTFINVKGKKDTNWDCSLSYVFIGRISYIATNTYYSNRYASYFTTKFQKIIVPKDFYFLILNIFKHAFSKKLCVSKYTGKYEVECDCKIISSFPSIRFVIGDKAFRFTYKDYFNQGEKKCKLMITNNTKGNDWIFGTQFIAKYHTTFDYEKKEIVFYSKENWQIIDLDLLFPKKQQYKLTVIIIFILLLGLLWKCMQLMWKKRTNKYNTKPIKTSKNDQRV